MGSVREVWWQSRNLTIQSTQYYPSGLPWSEGTGVGTQLNKYNGKIWDEMHGWDETDMGWRGQYPAINTFGSIDRKAEKYPWQSPYCVANNNTVRFIDLNGEGVPKVLINGVEVMGGDWLLGGNSSLFDDKYLFNVPQKSTSETKKENNEKVGSASYSKGGQSKWLDSSKKVIDNVATTNDIIEFGSRVTKSPNLLVVSSLANPMIYTFKIGIAVQTDNYTIGHYTKVETAKITAGVVGGAVGLYTGQELGGWIGGGIGLLAGGVWAIPGVAVGKAIGGAIGGFAGNYYSSEAVDKKLNENE